MYNTHQYVIDWDKVTTIEDMKLLLKAIDFSFDPNHKNIESIKHLVRLEEKPVNGFLSTANCYDLSKAPRPKK